MAEGWVSGRTSSTRHQPLQIIHLIGVFLRIWSIYSLYHYLSHSKVSVTVFLFSCLLPASIIFLVLQQPWKGRALPNSQVGPSVINGGITALYFILWGKGLKTCGPHVAILAEYAGAVLGVLSAVLYGRRSHIWRKVGGLLAMLASFYFLSQGWATRTHSPFYSINGESLAQGVGTVGIKRMAFPICAGILSALRRVISRRVSLKSQLKRRLHAVTMVSAACFLFPFTIWDILLGSYNVYTATSFPTWTYLSTITFGIVLIFYIDNLAEDRLQLVFSSPKHLMAAGGCIIIMEVIYNMDFSLTGFLICSLILGLGIFEATSLERVKKDALHPQDIAEESLQAQLQILPLSS